MSRRAIIFGNWKMNLHRGAATALAKAVAEGLGHDCPVEVGLCPPFVYLSDVAEAVKGSPVEVGAQNMYVEDPGAFTGEIAGQMILDVGATHVILGHSERRHVMGEPDELINAKVLKALDLGLKVILCIGELVDERQANQTEAVVDRQTTAGLAGVSGSQMANVVLAYEPVWAIGTGLAATPDQAQAVHEYVRGRLAALYDPAVADQVRIQYGGSVKPDNAADLLSLPDIDGALVGGAALKADLFLPIIEAAAPGSA